MPVADRYEIVTDARGLRALEAEWNALWARAGDDYVTSSFAWCVHAWEQMAQPLGRRLYTLVARDAAGRLTLVWPLVQYRYGPWRRARPLGPEVAEYSSILVERGPEMAERLAAAFAHVRRTARCDQIILPFVNDGSPLHALIEAHGGAVTRAETPTNATCPPEQGGDDGFLQKLQSASIEKRRRKLERRGELRYEQVTDPQRRAEIIAWLVGTKEERLVRGGEHALWKRTELYREFLTAVSADERVPVFALTLDGATLAASIARVDNRRFESFISTWDDEYKNFSVGQILRIENMRWAFARGLEYDLRVGDQEYKREWTNRHGVAVSYNVPLTAWGAVVTALRGAQRSLGRVRSRLRLRPAA